VTAPMEKGESQEETEEARGEEECPGQMAGVVAGEGRNLSVFR